MTCPKNTQKDQSAKSTSYLWPRGLKNHTLRGLTYLYSPYKRQPLPEASHNPLNTGLGLFRPIAWRINAKPKRTRIAFDTQVKTALLGTNHSIVLFLIKKELKYRKLYTVDCKVSNGLFPLDLRCIPSKKVILSIHGWLAIAFACRWRFCYSFANNLCSPEGFPHLLSALKSTLLKGFRVWQTWSAGLPKS